ncbi:MAG: hypothetical protein J6U54_10460 [Clostridiales bacterium]|nr:hypothetical protein [Clostridiales bacterium]
MNRGEMISKSELINKANYYITVMSKNITDIRTVNAGLNSAIADNIVTGKLGKNIVDHLESLVDLNDSFIELLQMDIDDNANMISQLERLITQSEDEFLDGTAILDGIEKYSGLLNDAKSAQANFYNECSNHSLDESLVAINYYDDMKARLQREVDEYSGILNEYYRKEFVFDCVVYNTQGLFTKNNDYRKVIQEGYSQLPKEWNGNTCSPLVTYAWKYNLAKIKTELTQERYNNMLFTTTVSGAIESINWDEVEKLIQTDSSELNNYQYMALASLYSRLSTDDLSRLFDYADVKDSRNNHSINYTLGKTLEYYYDYCVTSVDPISWENDRDVLRSTALLNTYRYIKNSNHNGDDFKVEFSSQYKWDSDILKSYTVSINFVNDQTLFEIIGESIMSSPDYQLYDPDAFGAQFDDDLASEMKNVTITFYANTLGVRFDQYLHEASKTYIDKMGGDWEGFILDQAGHYVYGKLSDVPVVGDIPGFSAFITLSTIPYDAAKQADTRSDADNAISLQNYGNWFNAVAAGGNLIYYDYERNVFNTGDSFAISNLHFDENELNLRITAYNTDHPNAPISLEEVEAGFNQAISGELDISLLDDNNNSMTNNAFVLFYRAYMSNENGSYSEFR